MCFSLFTSTAAAKPNGFAGLASNPVARVLPDLCWVAQVRKLLELVHCTLETLRLVSSRCIYLLQRRDQRAPLLLVRRVAIIGLIPPDLLGPTFITKRSECAIASCEGTSRGLRGTGASRTGAGRTHGIVVCAPVQSDIDCKLILPPPCTLTGAAWCPSRRPSAVATAPAAAARPAGLPNGWS